MTICRASDCRAFFRLALAGLFAELGAVAARAAADEPAPKAVFLDREDGPCPAEGGTRRCRADPDNRGESLSRCPA